VNRDLEKNAGSNEVKNLQEDKEINQHLEIYQRSEVLSSLQVCTIYSSQIKIHEPQSKRQKTVSSSLHRNLSQTVIKNIALAFIKPSLEQAVKASKTFPVTKSSIKMQKLKALINLALGPELTNLLINEKSEVLKHI
jgi:hypothetical protein